MDILITTILSEIKRVYGLDLKPDSDFPGIRFMRDLEMFFNIRLTDGLTDGRTSRSRTYKKLQRISKSKTIKQMGRVEPNGLNRVAIFITE